MSTAPKTPAKLAAGLPIHPAALEWPPLPEADLAALTESIVTLGQLDTIKMLDGEIVDGVHRATACERAGIKPRTENLPAGTDPWEYSATVNGRRRHVETPGQRTAIIFGLLRNSEAWKQIQAENAEKKTAGLKRGTAAGSAGTPGVPTKAKARKAKEVLAKKAGVGTTTAQDVINVAEKDPAKFEQVKKGKLSPKKAAKQVRDEEQEAKDEATPPTRLAVKKRSDALKAAVDEILGPLQKAHEGVGRAMKRLGSTDADLIAGAFPITLAEILGEKLEVDRLDKGTVLEPNLTYESSLLKKLTQLLRGKLPHGECPNCAGEAVCPGEKCLEPLGPTNCACGGEGHRCYLCRGLGFITKRGHAELKHNNPRFSG